MAILSNPLSHAFGLDIGDRSFKLVQVRYRGNKRLPRLVAWGAVDVPESVMERGEIKDMDAAVAALKKLLQSREGKLRGRAVAVCLPEARSFVKIIEVPVDGTEEGQSHLEEAVIEEIKQNIPLPIDEIYYDWQVVPLFEPPKEAPDAKGDGNEMPAEKEPASGAEQPGTEAPDGGADDVAAEQQAPAPADMKTTVLLAAAPKDLVDDYMHMLETAGLIPIVLEIEATAVTRAIVPSDKMGDVHLGILDIGATRSSLIIYDRGALQMSISIPISGNEITHVVSESLQIGTEEAEQMKKDCGLDVKRCGDKMWNILLPIIDDMTDRIRNALRFYRIGLNGRKIESIYLCGGGAHFKEIDAVLSRKLTMRARLANSLVNVDHRLPRKFPKDRALTYTTAIGLALRASYEHADRKIRT